MSVFCVIQCLDNISQHQTLKLEEMADILSMLILKPDCKKRHCFDYEYVHQKLRHHPALKKALIKAIESYCNEQIRVGSLPDIHLPLYVMPLLRFLQEVSQPFGDRQDNVSWKDLHGFSTMRSRIKESHVR